MTLFCLGIKKHITDLEGEIGEEMVVFDKWNDYKEYGQYEDEHRVSILEDELRDNQATFDEQSSNYKLCECYLSLACTIFFSYESHKKSCIAKRLFMAVS